METCLRLFQTVCLTNQCKNSHISLYHNHSTNKKHVNSMEEMVDYVVQSVESSLKTNPLKGALMMISNYMNRKEALSRLFHHLAPKNAVFVSARKNLNEYLSHALRLNGELHYSIINIDSLSSTTSPFVLGIHYLDFLKSNLSLCFSLLHS